MSARRRMITVGVGVVLVIAMGLPSVPAGAGDSHDLPHRHGRVLLVGSWHHHRGQFSSIQAAVDTARNGDWILVAPGDYHERADHANDGHASDATGGVLITKPGIHLRGMDRNRVIVDGTRPGSAPCASDPAAQDPGPARSDGTPAGRNGIEVYKADGVSVDNLTVCNFLRSGGGGNEIWFNGGDGSGVTGLNSYSGSYLSATSTHWVSNDLEAEYGIFASNVNGPGAIIHTYASNMADSGYYIGACPNCMSWLVDAHAQNNALGYSGTNSGGGLVVAFSEWDHNKTGISTNSQNNDDAPSPQDGSCPQAGPGPNGTGSCTFFLKNWIHDNNNPNVPSSGSADLGPVGTGMVLAGGRHDTIEANRVERNGAWGLLLVPFPDTGTPPPVANCAGGVANPGGLLGSLGVTCFFDDFGNDVRDNFLSGNGTFGNPTNGDLGEISGPNTPGNCWHGNVDPAGITSAPDALQTTHGQCGIPNQGAGLIDPLSLQVICATQAFGPCPPSPGMSYPRRTQVSLAVLPRQPSMPDPCAGVPENPWCNESRGGHDGHGGHD